MARQDQDVGEGAEAYQAGGDLTVNRGLSEEQMIRIMVSVSRELQAQFAQAEDLIGRRMEEFRESILKEFSRPETTAQPTAFGDPDFYFPLKDASTAFARSGDETLRDELIKLLAQRSAETTGSRTAHVLNRAISTAGSLTNEEYSALSVLFILKYVRIIDNSPLSFYHRFANHVKPFVDNLPRGNQAYDYLESLGLISINRVTGQDLSELLYVTYSGIFSRGFDRSELEKDPTVGQLLQNSGIFIGPLIASYTGKMRINVSNEAEIREKMSGANVDQADINKVIEFYRAHNPNAQEAFGMMTQHIPQISSIKAAWDKTLIPQSTLTLLGMAMAHSWLSAHSDFAAPLSIWVN